MKIPVLIPRVFDHPHTYLSGKFGKLSPGSLVTVPFGSDEEIGVIWDKQEETDRKFKLKTVLNLKNISFNKNLIEFINWFSIYNLVPKGMVLKMFLGDKTFLKKSSKDFYQTNFKTKLKFNLNIDQKKCLKEINSFGDKFNVTLLQGVTGSGKTSLF